MHRFFKKCSGARVLKKNQYRSNIRAAFKKTGCISQSRNARNRKRNFNIVVKIPESSLVLKSDYQTGMGKYFVGPLLNSFLNNKRFDVGLQDITWYVSIRFQTANSISANKNVCKYIIYLYGQEYKT